jgi:site-specific DNA recombinase
MTTKARTQRALIAARLSRNATEESSRIDRDDEAASAWAVGAGLEVVATSEDRNVSGSVSPFKRAGLGPWLSDPSLLAKFDVLVASSVDRLGRSAADLFRLREWAEVNGKSIRILSPPLSWPPAPDDIAGPIVWDVLARVAELELRMITQRYAATRAVVRENGAFAGKPPFGFEIVGERYNKRLQLRADLAPVLREMVNRALRGDTYTSIAEWLDASGISSVHGGPWSQTSVRIVLSSPALKGRYLGADGEVLHKFDGLMTAGEWKALQTALDRRPQRRGMITAETAMLTGVIFCEHCGGPMYRTKSKRRRQDGTLREWFYYRCGGTDRRRSACRNMVPLEEADSWVNNLFTEGGPWADTELVEIRSVPSEDHADDIADIEEEIRSLDFDAADFGIRQRDLLAERSRLRELPVMPPEAVEVPTGRTVGDVWAGLSDGARRSYLAAADVRVLVSVLGRTGGVLAAPGGEAANHRLSDPPSSQRLSDLPVRIRALDFSTGRHGISMVGYPNRLTGSLRHIQDALGEG